MSSKITYENLFRAFDNEIRREILKSLERHERCVMEIVKELRYDQTTVSHNLRYLNDCGLVFVHRQGKQRIYKINERTVLPLMKLIDKHMKEMEEDMNKVMGLRE